jgi:sugar lactone lactonase YvrE
MPIRRLLTLVIAAGLGAAAAQGVTTLHDIGLATPESVLYVPGADVYLVSNINGAPVEKDGNGFISRLAPDGSVIALKWIDGAAPGVALDAPKGMAIAGGVLYVADVTALRMFDAATGAPVGSVEIPGSTFLNDVAAGPDGTVYVTDSGLDAQFQASGSDAIYAYRNGSLSPVIGGPELDHPNGITVLSSGALLVVPFGGSKAMYQVSDGAIGATQPLPVGQLDGVVVLPGGDVLVSSWQSSSVVRVAPDGGTDTVASDAPAPADIGYDASRNRLLIPLFNDNAVRIVPLG